MTVSSPVGANRRKADVFASSFAYELHFCSFLLILIDSIIHYDSRSNHFGTCELIRTFVVYSNYYYFESSCHKLLYAITWVC